MGITSRSMMIVACLSSTALLPGCGGGGGGGGGSASTTTTVGSGWVQGKFSPAATFAAKCLAPRSGIDPQTQIAYPDKQGTQLDELNWLRSWTNDLYLWYGEVLDQNPANYQTDDSYFNVLKTTATTASGHPKDKFHFTYTTSAWESLSQSGVQAGYGANFVILAATPPRNVVVAYTEPGSPATDPSANLVRGAKLLTIDGVDVINSNTQAEVDTLNAGLSPATTGESHTFTVMDPGASVSRSITMVSADVTSQPVQNVHTIAAPNGDLVGYMLFNDHLATAESALVAAFTQLQSAGVKDLVLDIRYNGGGYLDIASEVAYMIAGSAVTNGKTFELTQFNDKHPTIDPVSGQTITPVGFHSTAMGFSVTSGQALPALNLTRVFVLTGPSTCSASEAIINSLRGIDIQVIQIGSTTCGKPYGFYPTDNCGITYFSIQFQGVNNKNFGAYPDGFTPANTVATQGVTIPGCSVADDFTHALGNSSEGILASALAYQATGVCPVAPSGAAAPPAVSTAYVPPAAAGQSVKSIWLRNRILRPPSDHR